MLVNPSFSLCAGAHWRRELFVQGGLRLPQQQRAARPGARLSAALPAAPLLLPLPIYPPALAAPLPPASALSFPQGYFALVGLSRVHCLLGDYNGALRSLDPIDLDKQGLFTKARGRRPPSAPSSPNSHPRRTRAAGGWALRSASERAPLVC